MKKDNKNYILSIETTSKVCGVALVYNDKILYENNIDIGLNHSITLFKNIDDMLHKTKIDISEISKIKVSNGPGSFTGVRIGIAAAIGLSEKYDTCIEYIDTLEALAYNVKNKNDYILSMIDAKVNRVYISVYDSRSLKKMSNDSIVNINDLVELLNKFFTNQNVYFSFVGDGAVNYKKIFKDSLRINYKVFDKESNLSAVSVALTNGVVSKVPIINYMLASKAEREKNGKC